MQLLIDESKQSSLTLFFWKVLKRTLAEVQQPVIDLADKISPEELKKRVPHLLDDKKMKKVIDEIWITVGHKVCSGHSEEAGQDPSEGRSSS